MNDLFEKVTRIIIIALLTFAVYSLFEMSQNGRYQTFGKDYGWIIDTKTGEIYYTQHEKNPTLSSPGILKE